MIQEIFRLYAERGSFFGELIPVSYTHLPFSGKEKRGTGRNAG